LATLFSPGFSPRCRRKKDAASFLLPSSIAAAAACSIGCIFIFPDAAHVAKRKEREREREREKERERERERKREQKEKRGYADYRRIGENCFKLQFTMQYMSEPPTGT
jgi:hypothetical protein